MNSESPNSQRPSAPRSQQGPEMLVDLLHAQRLVSQQAQELHDLRARLGRRTHQLGMLQHVAGIIAATPKINQVAGTLLDVFAQEYNAKHCVVWVLGDEGNLYQPKAGHGLPRSVWTQMALPAPNPFPHAPILLFQPQLLEEGVVRGDMEAINPDKSLSLYFVPFEQQLLLMGFAILALEGEIRLDEDQEIFSILQRQVAVSLYNAWLFRDLAQQRDTLRRQAEELETANVALREADRFKSEFLALTSHELRTPLTGILGFTRLVLDELYEDEVERRQMLEDSYHSGQHLLALLNDILDLAKIEAGRMPIHIENFSLADLVNDVKPLAMAYPRTESVALIWPENLQDMPDVSADIGRLKQVFLNVLSNAIKFTRQGSVRVEVERGIGEITLRIVDTGIGIKPEDAQRLFQKFVQAEGGHSREFGGTGLGLVICKHLMGMMHGSISLTSEGQGKGSTATLVVPIS